MATLIPALGACSFDSTGERRLRERPGDFQPAADHIHVMTMHVSKGLEFPVVALPGVGHMPAPGEPEKDEARLLYVAATRATQRLVLGVGGDGVLGTSLLSDSFCGSAYYATANIPT